MEKLFFSNTFVKLLIFLGVFLASTNSFKVSGVVNYYITAEFIHDLQTDNFKWDKYVTFMKHLPFTNNTSEHIIEEFANGVYDLFKAKKDIITKEFMKVVNLKHEDGDVKANLPFNM